MSCNPNTNTKMKVRHIDLPMQAVQTIKLPEHYHGCDPFAAVACPLGGVRLIGYDTEAEEDDDLAYEMRKVAIVRDGDDSPDHNDDGANWAHIGSFEMALSTVSVWLEESGVPVDEDDEEDDDN